MASEALVIDILSDIKDAVSGINKVSSKFDSMGEKVKMFAIGGAAALGTFAVGLGIKSVNAAKDLDSAVKNLGKQVGASTSEMKEYESILTDLYKDNVGENFQDVADMIAEVRKQTKLSGTELKLFTGYAADFGEAFEQEISESTRSANMLMEKFGLTSEQSFNLMIQGMEKGLNKNDDFLDSINEYSTHFKDLGFTAEEMFDLYSKGAETGAFSIDKLGDAVKEFNIRSKDGTDASIKAMEELGLNAKKTLDKFAIGGDSAKEAFDDIITGIQGIDDRIEQDAIGVALFGTMWEDLGGDVVMSLGDAKSQFDKTKNSAEALNSVEYKDLDSMLSTLGRTIEVDLLVPIGQDLMPILMDLLDETAKNLPGIIDKFKEWGSVVKTQVEDAGGVEGFWEDIWSMPDMSGFKKDLDRDINDLKKVFTDAGGFIARNVQEKSKYIQKLWQDAWKFPDTGNFFSSLKGQLASIKNYFASVLSGIKNNIQRSIYYIIGKAYLWGRNIINNLITGIYSKFRELRNAAYAAAQTIKNFIGWHSPTKEGPGADSDKWAPNLMKMFANGISMNISGIENSANQVAGSMESGFANNAVSGRGNTGGTVQLVNANIYNETMVNMLINRIKRELVSGGV